MVNGLFNWTSSDLSRTCLFYWLVNCSIDLLIAQSILRLIDSMDARSFRWLIDWLTACSFCWVIHPLIDWLTAWMHARSIDWLIDWQHARSVDWSMRWLIDWQHGCLLASSIDWFNGWLVDCVVFLCIYIVCICGRSSTTCLLKLFSISSQTLVATFAISGFASAYYRASTKPFNPLLGETYGMRQITIWNFFQNFFKLFLPFDQFFLKNFLWKILLFVVAECIREDKGFRYIAEQVSHHPPISACHAESLSDKYCYWQGKFSSLVFLLVFWSFVGLFVGLFSWTKVFDDFFRFSTENSLLGPVYRNYESRWGARHHQQERALPVE